MLLFPLIIIIVSIVTQVSFKDNSLLLLFPPFFRECVIMSTKCFFSFNFIERVTQK